MSCSVVFMVGNMPHGAEQGGFCFSEELPFYGGSFLVSSFC